MAESLVIHMKDRADGLVHWYVLDGQGNRIGLPTDAPLKGCAEHATQRRVVVLVPGERISLLDARVPTRKRQKVLQAVPWVVEDRLAEDVESLHFVLGPWQPDGSVRVGVVARADMSDWTDALAQAGIEADAILPDFLALPRPENGWAIFVTRDRILVRTGECAGFAADTELAPELLDILVERCHAATESEEDAAEEGRDLVAPSRVSLSFPEDAAGFADSLEGRLAGLGVETAHRPYRDRPANALMPELPPRLPLDLAQGEYRLKRVEDNWWWPWRPVAALAAGWLLLLVIAEGLHVAQLARERAELEQRVETLFFEAMPDAERMVNPRVRLERRLAALRGGGVVSGFMPALAATGEGIAALGDGNLTGLSYRPGILDLNLTVPDVQALDHFKENVEQAGPYDVSIQSANTRDDHVEGRVQIREGGN
jgi:general secretion pathway protein L